MAPSALNKPEIHVSTGLHHFCCTHANGGAFLGSLASVSAPQLGSTAILGALQSGGVQPEWIDEVFMGNVLQAGGTGTSSSSRHRGRSWPKRSLHHSQQGVRKRHESHCPWAQSIALGDADFVVVGGMENMSAVPHYVEGRRGVKFGNMSVNDGMLVDGLTDVYNATHMGNCAELCAREKNISREEQDAFAIESYRRATDAWGQGKFDREVVPVNVPQRRGDDLVVSRDEEYTNVRLDKIPTLRPAFDKEGSVTAANASTLNDGASALILASAEACKSKGLQPIAKILSSADAAQAPEWFTTAPAVALPKALDKAQLKVEDIDLWELNEAFSVVGIANNRELGLDTSKVNVHGGAVALGHPLGSSGSRIVVTLIHALKDRGLKYGAAGICNGGGGASAMVIELC